MLRFSFCHRQGDFSLTASGELERGVTALVGRSGAGKSSLLRLIAGLERARKGRTELEGKVWFDSQRRVWLPVHRRRIGMVFQTPLLLPHLSVARNIALGARGNRVSEDLVERTGCTPLLERPVAGLSGGEQQRVMLARALAGQPRLMLLDEPLSALDSASRNDLLVMMGEVFDHLKVPVLYVTHDMEEAARLTQRFMRIEKGRLLDGEAEELPGPVGGGGKEPIVSSVLEGVVASIEGGGIARIDVGQQSLEIARGDLEPGSRVRVRLWARDLMLAHSRPPDISARNALVGRITELEAVANSQVLVNVRVEKSVVRALVFSRTAREMELKTDQAIFLIFKSAGLEPVSGPVRL